MNSQFWRDRETRYSNKVASGEVEYAVRADCSDRTRGHAMHVSWTAPGRISTAPTFREAKDCFTVSVRRKPY